MSFLSEIRIDMAVPRTLSREEEDTVIAEDMVIVEDTEEEVGTTKIEGTSSTEVDTLAVIVVEVTKVDLIEEAAEATQDTILTEHCLEI